jgi:hypothetical protein
MKPTQIPEPNPTSETADTNELNTTYRTYGQFHGNPTPGQLQAYLGSRESKNQKAGYPPKTPSGTQTP